MMKFLHADRLPDKQPPCGHAIVKRFLTLVLGGLLMSSSIFAQVVTVSGTVTSSDDSTPIPGVTVLVKGSGNGTSTDAEGKFKINIDDANAVLVFSFIGYATQEVQIASRTTVDVVLSADIMELNEVVVIGYGEVKKSNVTGAIVSVKGEELRRVPTTNIMESLQGNVPGMDVTRTSGAAGGNISIRVRGQRSLTADSDPLYIVDGVQYSNIQDLNSNDVQSIEVLKDAASTAIYGSRGANGVIMITTKKGAPGKTKVFLNAYGGPSSINGYPKVQNGEEYANQRREAKRAAGQWSGPADDATAFSAAELENIRSGTYTDWQDQLLRNGYQQDYQVGLSSATEKTSIYLSLNYFKEQGLFIDDKLNRYSFRVNVDHIISKVFKVGIQNQLTYYNQDLRTDPLNTANKLSPLEDAYDANGNLIPIVNNLKTVNPMMDIEGDNYTNNVLTSRLFNSVYLQINPIKNLTFRTILGVTNTSIRQGFFASALTVTRNNTPALTSYSNTVALGLNLENILTYQKKFGEHALTVTGVQSILRNKSEVHQSSGQNQLLPSQGPYGLGNANSAVATSAQYVESALLSYTGRIMYDYKEKYLLTIVGRSDGASQLSSGSQWAFFPSVSAAWRIAEEGFMENISTLSDLKLRASYGTAGNYAVQPYSTQSGLVRMPFAFDERLAVGYPLNTSLGNDDLGWEISTTTNVGLDFGLLQNRITGTVDVFKTSTKDLLLERLLPSSSGFTRTIQNVGETETSGVELALSAMVIDKGSFSWRIGASYFKTREKIVALATGANDIANGWFIGEPTRAWYDYENLGVWQTDEADRAADFGQFPGEIKVQDQDGNNLISSSGATDDRVILGSPRPKGMANITSDIKFKNFDFSFQVFARWGQMIQYTFATVYDPTANENSIKHNYWTPENPSNEYPRPNANTSPSAVKYLSTLLYEDASFVKLRGVTIGYNFPKSLLEKTPFSNARIYVNGKNLWTLSKIDNYDPEGGGGQPTPLSKLFVAGINIEF